MTKKKPFWEMNATELARATREFDKEFVLDTFGRPPPEAKAAWDRTKEERSRPGNKQAQESIRITVQRQLLRRGRK